MLNPLRVARSALRLGVSAAGTAVGVGRFAYGVVASRLGGSDESEPKREVSEPTSNVLPVGTGSVAPEHDASSDIAAEAAAAAAAELARPVERLTEVNPQDIVESVVSEPVEDPLVYSTSSAED